MATAAKILRMPGWRRFVPDPQALRVPEEFADRMDAGGCGVLAGRCSSSDGHQGRRSAAQDLNGAAAHLARDTGFDVRGLLPSTEVLQAKLADAEVRTSMTSDGRPFRNRYVVIDERARAGVVLLVSVGSGHLLDEDEEQPFVRYAARLIRRYDALLFACKRLDRGAREDWGTAPLMLALRQRNAYLYDEDGLGKIDFARGINTFLKGGGSRKQADDIPYQTRDGQLQRSGTELQAGRAPYYVSTPPPPGFATAWLHGAGGTPTDRVVFLDCDEARPADAEVAYGLPEVYTDEDPSRRVDQVANVRFLLSVLGKPGWSMRRLAAEMTYRKYSTPGLRQRRGPDAILPHDDAQARHVLNRVIDNLEVYETGVLRRALGAGVEPVEITGCWPLDGQPWASAEDFERIRAYRRGIDLRTARAVQMTFAGVTATYNGVPVRLTTGRWDSRRQGERTLRYQFVLEADYPQRQVKADLHIPLPWQPFAESLVDAFTAAGEVPLRAASAAELAADADDGLSELRAEEAHCRREIARLEASLATMRTRLEDTDEHGAPILRGALLDELQTGYNRIAEEELPATRARHQTLVTDLEQRSAKQQATATADAALLLIESLRDPTDRRYRHLWLASIRQLKVHAERFRRHGKDGKRLSWTGAVQLTHHDEVFLLPFSGSYETGAAVAAPQRTASAIERVVAAMADGTPFRDAAPTTRIVTAARAAAHLGADPDEFLLGACDDPAITRIAVACLQRPDATDTDLASALDVDPRLVARVRAVHTGEAVPKAWRQRRAVAEAAFYAVAACHDGRVTAEQVADLTGASKGQVYNTGSVLRADTGIWSTQRKRGYLLEPCACGSTARAVLTIPEPVGPVCRHCRTDLAGLVWPADPYDGYLAHPELWDRLGWPGACR